jgi:LIM domain/Protein DA1
MDLLLIKVYILFRKMILKIRISLMKILFKICFISFLFIASAIVGQTVKCNYCGKKITSEYIVVDGKPYHQKHFKCANCNKPIVGEYSSKNGKYFDKECYEKLYALKCSICNESINGKYLIDNFGLKYHKYHESELERCNNCNRLISERTTHGGVKYSDGRNICNICTNKKLNSIYEFNRSLNKVISRLNNYGLTFNKSSIELKTVDLNELQNISGNRYSKSIQGFTHTRIEKIGSKTTFEHTVYVLNGIPEKNVESTMAHELMHIWISENLDHKLSRQFEEGSCNYISYTYLKSDYSDDAEAIIKQLEDNPDKVYGDGFRKVYERFKGRDFNLFLNYLKNNNSI